MQLRHRRVFLRCALLGDIHVSGPNGHALLRPAHQRAAQSLKFSISRQSTRTRGRSDFVFGSGQGSKYVSEPIQDSLVGKLFYILNIEVSLQHYLISYRCLFEILKLYSSYQIDSAQMVVGRPTALLGAGTQGRRLAYMVTQRCSILQLLIIAYS